MSKPDKLQKDAKKMNNELHEMTDKSFRDGVREAWVFVKRLAASIFAVGVGGSGVLAEVHATAMYAGLYRDAVIVSGVCASLAGIALLYAALMKIGKD